MLIGSPWPGSGFWGGRIDATIMALVDIMLAFPQLILAFAMWLYSARGSAISFWSWPHRMGALCPGRACRGVSLARTRVRAAARAVGVPNLKIVFGHIMPNTFSSVISWPRCRRLSYPRRGGTKLPRSRHRPHLSLVEADDFLGA